MPRPLNELVDPGWADALAPVEDHIHAMGDFLREESAHGRTYQPAPNDILNAFTRHFADVKVLIVGQDPYPTPGHAMGLSFSVHPDVNPIPRTLTNIFRELGTDISAAPPRNGDLTPWADQGVLLLNRVLTVESGMPGSHRGKGWETVTEHAIRALVARNQPLVAILWGRDAATARPFLEDTPCLSSAHPSPLSANRGFFNSRPFSKANEQLRQLGGEEVDWHLPSS